MGDISARNFGLLIAYLVPGFIALWGLSYGSEGVRAWLVGGAAGTPGVGSALYVLIASVGCGMAASAFRWAIIDTVHHHTGLKRPQLNESRLAQNLEAFDYQVENHYRYYQFYGNTIIASIGTYVAWRTCGPSQGVGVGAVECGLLLLVIVFALGSRDALARYYAGGALLLGTIEQEVFHDERQTPAQGCKTNQDGSPRTGGEAESG